MKMRFTVEAEIDMDWLAKGAGVAEPGEVLTRTSALIETCEDAICDGLNWKDGIVYGTVKVQRLETLESSAVAERLKAFVRDVSPGGCRVLSMGGGCTCPLCDIDRLVAGT